MVYQTSARAISGKTVPATDGTLDSRPEVHDKNWPALIYH
jgi:hypothetical protein